MGLILHPDIVQRLHFQHIQMLEYPYPFYIYSKVGSLWYSIELSLRVLYLICLSKLCSQYIAHDVITHTCGVCGFCSKGDLGGPKLKMLGLQINLTMKFKNWRKNRIRYILTGSSTTYSRPSHWANTHLVYKVSKKLAWTKWMGLLCNIG